MAQVKFGVSSISNPTPQKVANIINISSAIAGAVIAWLQTVDFIPAQTVKIISGICGLLVMVALAVKPFFGVHSDQTEVPIEEVGTMKNNSDNQNS